MVFADKQCPALLYDVGCLGIERLHLLKVLQHEVAENEVDGGIGKRPAEGQIMLDDF